MMSHSGWFRNVSDSLADLDLNVVGADRRGSGLNETARGDAPSRNALISDFLQIMRSEDLQLPRIVVGWCWGASLAINLALEPQSKLSGVVLLAPGIFPSVEVKRRIRAESQLVPASEWASPVLSSPITEGMFSDRVSIQSFIRTDVLAQRHFSRRFFQISSEMSLISATRLSQLTEPVLLLLAEMDLTADNKTTRKYFSRIRREGLTQATLNCHHCMQLEVPLEVIAHFSKWLCDQGVLGRSPQFPLPENFYDSL
jgi:pimeloyl-ACP methyl ester carboxylesterase